MVLLLVVLLVMHRRGRPAGYGDIGLEMGRQEGLARLLESAENLVAMAALAAIVAARHIEVLAVTATTAAAKVRFNFPPGLINIGCYPRLPQ
jgi:hypothetical protein